MRPAWGTAFAVTEAFGRQPGDAHRAFAETERLNTRAASGVWKRPFRSLGANEATRIGSSVAAASGSPPRCSPGANAAGDAAGAGNSPGATGLLARSGGAAGALRRGGSRATGASHGQILAE